MPHPESENPRAAGQGLRERKKAKTREAIQRHALRLFRGQGYARTTVEQIAHAAEVSASTFFRYFPTKEDVVLYDDYDPLFMAAFRAQPPEAGPLQALRAAMHEVFDSLSEEQRLIVRERTELAFAVPELRERVIAELTRSALVLSEEIAVRAGREPDDFRVRVTAGAVVGVAIAAADTAVHKPDTDYMDLVAEALEYLEQGLPL